MPKQADKPVSITTKKTKKTVSIVVDGVKYQFPQTPPLDLALVLLNVEDERPTPGETVQIVQLFRAQVLPEGLRDKLNDLEDIMTVFEAWVKVSGLEQSKTGAPTSGPRSRSSASIEVK